MMATYNGEKYIEEQIESIINQTYENWKLIIQDDGSEDKTVQIINYFCKKDSRITFRKNDTSVHGAFSNFHSLINYCKTLEKYDYYMFSDQDDIWFNNKIEFFVDYFHKESKESIPFFCYADLSLIDGDGKKINDSLNSIWKIDGKNRVSLFFSHKVYGCNMMINEKLFRIVPELDINNININIMSHDNYYAKFAAVFGGFAYLNVSLMDYRRHDNNETANQKFTVDFKRLLYRVSHINDLAKKHANIYNQTLVTIAMLKKKKLNNKQRKFIDVMETVIKTGGFKALKFCSANKVLWGNRIENISRKLILTLGIYRKYLIDESDIDL